LYDLFLLTGCNDDETLEFPISIETSEMGEIAIYIVGS
jgi:hypothetical protein